MDSVSLQCGYITYECVCVEELGVCTGSRCENPNDGRERPIKVRYVVVTEYCQFELIFLPKILFKDEMTPKAKAFISGSTSLHKEVRYIRHFTH